MKIAAMKPASRPLTRSLTSYLPLAIFALAFGLVLLAASTGLAQGDAAAPDAAAAKQQTIIDLILHGGPLIIAIWLAILVTSITMVTLVIQNFLTLRKPVLAPPALVDSLRQTMEAGNYQEAWEICRANNCYLANVMRSGLERIGRGKDNTDDALTEAGLREAQLVRTRNSYLSVIGVISPMIGLLGTVIGMMGAFANLGASGVGDTRKLASSIGEVLLATASGLFIAIPAFVFYYLFRNWAQTALVHADDQLNRLVQDIPFEEIEGVRIGENFSAEGAGATAGASSSRKVSMALTTNCPVCNGPVQPGVNPCPHCGATLDWN